MPTCIGCGSITEFGTCEQGCTEQELELVPATDFDRLAESLAETRTRSDAFAAIVRSFAAADPEVAGFEIEYRSLQQAARYVLRRYPQDTSLDAGGEQSYAPSQRVTTWWCPECGGIDAPQPCLGVCIRRPVEWVTAARYEREQALTLAERDRERILRTLLRDLAFVTPREGQWKRNWSALAARTQAVSPGDGDGRRGARALAAEGHCRPGGYQVIEDQ